MRSKPDPSIMRIRETRHRISEQFDHEPRKAVDHYMELQKRYTGRLLASEEEMEAEADVSSEPVVA